MIFKLKPALKSYIWGGTKLKTEWHKQTELATVSESWELSFHPDGEDRIVGGEYDGMTLAEVVTKEQWGRNCNEFEFFPVLNKLIDAKTDLSVQVHPSDEYALEPGAKLYMGLNRTLTAEEFAAAIDNKTICEYLNAVEVRPGETYFIPSGTLHAIGGGITLFEIQQNSSLTYRVYDYDRRDANGNPRQLHVEKAKKVTNLNKYDVPNPARKDLLGKCKYFAAYRYTGAKEFCFADSFMSLTVTDGEISANEMPLAKGDTIFVTAGDKVSVSGSGTYILTTVEK